MIEAARTVFSAMAYTATVRPVVEGYQRAVLERNRWTNQAFVEQVKTRFAERGVEKDLPVEVILNPNRTSELSEADFSSYLEEVEKERIKAKLSISNPGECPLLVAENLQVQAERVLIDLCEPLTGIKAEQASYSLKLRERYLDLLLKIFAPQFSAK